MYSNEKSGFNKSSGDFHRNIDNKIFFEMSRTETNYENSYNNATGIFNELEPKSSKENIYKSKDLFITKLNSTFINPKYIYF